MTEAIQKMRDFAEIYEIPFDATLCQNLLVVGIRASEIIITDELKAEMHDKIGNIGKYAREHGYPYYRLYNMVSSKSRQKGTMTKDYARLITELDIDLTEFYDSQGDIDV